jgi:hypothetical protein
MKNKIITIIMILFSINLVFSAIGNTGNDGYYSSSKTYKNENNSGYEQVENGNYSSSETYKNENNSGYEQVENGNYSSSETYKNENNSGYEQVNNKNETSNNKKDIIEKNKDQSNNFEIKYLFNENTGQYTFYISLDETSVTKGQFRLENKNKTGFWNKLKFWD